MATQAATDLTTKPRVGGEWGTINKVKGAVALPSNWANADVIRPCIIPAGMEVDAIELALPAALCAAAGNVSVGYTPVNSADGSLAASANYFSAGGNLTAPFAAATNSLRLKAFAPIKFEQDVFLDITVQSAPTTPAAGSLYAAAEGEYKGAM